MRYRSKTIAAWIALVGGSVGLHRLYLRGPRDGWLWAHLPPTALGLVGAVRMNNLGQDDRAAWLLVPVLGLMLSQAMLLAIVYALTPDERWDARHNAGVAGRPSGWLAVLAAVAALVVGGAVFIGTIAFSTQKYFEWQYEAAPAASSRSGAALAAQKIQVLTT